VTQEDLPENHFIRKGVLTMKKGLIVFTIILAVSLVFSGMLFAQAKKGPAADGKALWDFIQKEKHQNWKMWPGTEPQYKGPEPHGAFLTTYVNQTAFDSIKAKKGKFADGAMIVQDNFDKNKKLKHVDVMYKVKGYNPTGGDWFWAQFKASGKLDQEGKIDECIKCHEAQKTNDYVYTSKMK
jgi:hypothetical protein